MQVLICVHVQAQSILELVKTLRAPRPVMPRRSGRGPTAEQRLPPSPRARAPAGGTQAAGEARPAFGVPWPD